MSDERGGDPHRKAFEAFAVRAMDRFEESIQEIILFGSTVSGDTRGVDSDVDIFVVVADESDREEALRDIAYDVQLEYGVVISLHVISERRFEERKDHPFVKNVRSHGQAYG